MPYDDRDRSHWRDEDRDLDRWRGEEEPRGMFGYEGEGYMRGGAREVERDDFGTGAYGRRAAYGERGPLGMDRGYDDLESSRSRNFRAPEPRGTRGEAGRVTWGPSFRGRGPKNYQRSDDRIMEEVCERLTQDDHVDASDMEVNVSGGVVTLTGMVHERNDKRRAEDIADSVSGVREVHNQLRLNRGNR